MTTTTIKRKIDPSAAKVEAQRLSNKILVGGELRASASSDTFDITNPATLEKIATLPRCGIQDINDAVSAAHDAFQSWGRMQARDRGRLIARAADLVEAQLEPLAQLQTLETGHAISTQSRGDIAVAVDMLRLFAGVAGELKGQVVPDSPGILHYTTCEPLGVVAGILPWNGPVFTMSAKVGPALVAGNTIVLKSPEAAPLAVLRFAEIIQSVLPPGVINVISGSGSAMGKPLVQHPLVKKVTFTGSLAVGQTVSEYAARKIIPVTLELGGKNPNIVLDDADLSIAIPGLVAGMRFARQGQSCISGSRLIVHEAVYDEVIEGAVALMNQYVVGDPFDEATDIGAVISQKQLSTIQSFVDGVDAYPGARVLCGGKVLTEGSFGRGYFMRPTLIDNVPSDAEICREEIFGPVAVAIKVSSFEEAIRIANDSQYGLAAALWTRSVHRAMSFAEQIESGFVQVNQYAGTKPNLSYGGWKNSGIGKEFTLQSMLTHFTRSKTVQINAGPAH
nr:aldehyde dehydrogenase family protein [uncultured Devosia sp.]